MTEPCVCDEVVPLQGGFLGNLFSTDFVPRAQCVGNRAEIVWLHVISDATIALAYFSIPLALMYFVRHRKDLSFSWMFVMFAAFILFCGLTHTTNILAFWWPMYRLDGLVKALTGMLSVATAWSLWLLMPKLLALPSPTDLREANEQLAMEVEERRLIESKLRTMSERLSLRVEESTAEVRTANHELSRRVTELESFEDTLSKQNLELERVNSEVAFQQFALDQHAIVAITDRSGVINYVNDKFCEISGYSRAELIGQDHRIINSGYHDKSFFKELYKTIAHGSVWRGEICNRAKDGHLYWVDTTIVPSKDATGKATRYVAIRADITERKLAEQNLAAAHTLLEDKNTKLAAMAEQAHRFVDDVSHEFRTPLTVIKEFASIVADGLAGPVTEEQNQFLHHVDNAVLDLNQMVEDFLDSSKLRAGCLRVDRRRHDVASIFAALRPTVVRKASSRKITIEEIVPPDLPSIFADEEKVRRVILNLMTNAIKFSSDGSNITLRAIPLPEGDIRIEVTDHGLGLSADELARLFVRFQQFESARSPGIKGFGLGLSIAKELTWLNLGTITVRSQPGVGSTFAFTVPVDDPAVILDRFMQRLDDRDEAGHTLALLRVTASSPNVTNGEIRAFLATTCWATDIVLASDLPGGPVIILGATSEPNSWTRRLRTAAGSASKHSGRPGLESIAIELVHLFESQLPRTDAIGCALRELELTETNEHATACAHH